VISTLETCLEPSRTSSGKFFGVFNCKCDEDAIFYGEIEQDVICHPQHALLEDNRSLLS
jgi:hypothetical protein